jgi:L-ribulokinase
MGYTLGVDYGTNSVRAVVVNCADGSEAGTSVFDYPSGEQGILLDKSDHNLARQNPADYLLGLEASVRGALASAAKNGVSAEQIVGIGVDTTGSTPLPVDAKMVPLAMHDNWKDHLAAHAWLWKDHTSAAEAEMITKLAKEHRPEYLAKCGNTYSSEWFWSKLWHCVNTAPEVFDAAFTWIECADYIPAVLAGVTDPMQAKRGVCPAGHKAMYCDAWGGYPDAEFLAFLEPRLSRLRERLPDQAFDAATAAGVLCEAWASKLGLKPGIPIAIGAFDAHYGAVGAGVAPGTLVKIIGTSTCDCTVSATGKAVADIPGICGIVAGSILPGCMGLEAGQSAVGDIFKWWVEGVCGDAALHEKLTQEAVALKPGQSGLLALDWNNGNRTILVDPRLTGLLIGQTLHTTPAEIYRALIEATAFGARAIIERIREYGVPTERIVCCGGIAEKNPMLMQIYADVTGCTMQVSASSQTCALGAAIAAAVLAQEHLDFPAAQAKMTGVKDREYAPDRKSQAVYDELYALYRTLHDAFGGVARESKLGHVMKALLAIKEQQR